METRTSCVPSASFRLLTEWSSRPSRGPSTDCADPCSQTWDIWMHIFDVLSFHSQSKTGAVAKNDEKHVRTPTLVTRPCLLLLAHNATSLFCRKASYWNILKLEVWMIWCWTKNSWLATFSICSSGSRPLWREPGLDSSIFDMKTLSWRTKGDRTIHHKRSIPLIVLCPSDPSCSVAFQEIWS